MRKTIVHEGNSDTEYTIPDDCRERFHFPLFLQKLSSLPLPATNPWNIGKDEDWFSTGNKSAGARLYV
jgi:hypothetical protein